MLRDDILLHVQSFQLPIHFNHKRAVLRQDRFFAALQLLTLYGIYSAIFLIKMNKYKKYKKSSLFKV